MILCELEEKSIKGYELSPIKENIKKYREEQLAQGFKIYSATTNTGHRLTDFHFKAQNVNGIAIKEDIFHILEMYSYDSDNLALYEDVWKKYVSGEYDSLNVYTVSQSMKLSNDVRIIDILRLLIIDDYKKLNVPTNNPNKDIYQAKTILQLNEKLHFLQLLLQDTPAALNSSLAYFNLSEESLKGIFDNFNFSGDPVFVSPLDYIDKMQRAGLAVKSDYMDLSKKSEATLKLVRSSKK